SQIAQGQFYAGFASYQEAFKNPHPLARDCKTTFIRMVSSNPQAVASLPQARQAEVLAYVVKLSEENLAENPNDSLKNLEFGQLMDLVSRFQKKDSASQNEYHQKAIAALDRAIASSPGRATVYFFKGQILASAGDYQGAEMITKQGVALNTNYPEGFCRLSAIYNLEKKDNEALSAFNQCDKLDGLEYATVPSFLVNAASSSVAVNNFEQAIRYTKRLTVLVPNDYRLFINLARMNEAAGHYEDAITAAVKVRQLEPSLATDSTMYINQLELKVPVK
ncbi:MAG: tetratricopeptide repeat protein, partial [Patescibacteria group bacterium]